MNNILLMDGFDDLKKNFEWNYFTCFSTIIKKYCDCYVVYFSIYLEMLPLEVEFIPGVLFVNRPDVALPALEVVEFVLEPPDVVEFDCENADVVIEAANTALNIVTVKMILTLNFVLLLLIKYGLLK